MNDILTNRIGWLAALAILILALFMTTQPVFADPAGPTQAEIDAAPVCGGFPAEGEEYLCSCPAGFSTGGIWGSGPYTGDSNICAAAQQSGAITSEGGPVLAIAAPGQSAYTGASRNGITSSDWKSYDRSFEIVPIARPQAAAPEACGKLPDGTDSYQCSCAAGAGQGASVWGSSPYTYDSNICAAAVQSGVIDKTGGVVTVLRIQGLDRYVGSESNGVTSRDWGKYSSSFVFDWNE